MGEMKAFLAVVMIACLLVIHVTSDDSGNTPEENVLPETADDYNYDDRNRDDLEPAESMVFRPMFAYKKMMERRKKWQTDHTRPRYPYHY